MIWRDIRLSDRELTGTERAECRVRGELDDSGVKAALSRVARDCYRTVSSGFFINKVMMSYPIRCPSRSLLVLFIAQLLSLGADAHAVADFLDAHVLEVGLVHLHEVLAVDVVVCWG